MLVEATVKYVNKPAEGKKYGSIKTSEGAKYLLPKGLETKFQENEVCKFDVYKENWKDGPVEIIANKVWTGGEGAQVPKQVTRQRTNPTDRDDILVAVLLKEPRFDDMPTTQIVQLILKHKEVARLTATSQRRDDMNDEIPTWPALHQSENPAD